MSKPTAQQPDWPFQVGAGQRPGTERRSPSPFRARIGTYLKPGESALEIEVTNLSAHRIRDLELSKVDWRIMRDINIVDVNDGTFDPAHWPLEPSGPLGPVKLISEKRFSPTLQGHSAQRKPFILTQPVARPKRHGT